MRDIIHLDEVAAVGSLWSQNLPTEPLWPPSVTSVVRPCVQRPVMDVGAPPGHAGPV